MADDFDRWAATLSDKPVRLGLSSNDPAVRQAPADAAEAPAEKPRYAPAPTTEEGAQARLAEVQSAESEIRAWAESKRLKKSGGRPSSAPTPQPEPAADKPAPGAFDKWASTIEYAPPPAPAKPGLLARAGTAIKEAAAGLASAKVDGSSASLGPDRSRPQSLSQHLAENARAVTAESALKPGQMPLPEGVEPSTGRRMGAKAGEAAAYERGQQPYRSRQEAIDDAVDRLESGADPKQVYDAFFKSPMVITSTEIDARGLELGGPHFSTGRTGTVRPGAMDGQVRRIDRGAMPGDQRLLEPMLDALKRAKEQIGLSTDVVSSEAGILSKEGLSNRIVQRTRAIDAAAPTLENIEGQRAIQMAGKQGLLDAMRAMRDNPLSTLTMLVDSTLQSLPISVAAGGLGFAAGGPIGGAAGAYAGSGAQEYAAAILEAVREHAGNPNNPADVLAALQNPEVMAAARKKGLIRGLTVGAFDAMSAGLAGRFVGPVIKAIEGGVLAGGAAKKAAAVATGKEVGMQAGLGAGGEITGTVAAGDQINWSDALMEAMAEIPGGIPEAAGNIMHERGKAPRPTEQKAAIHSRLDDFAVQTGMPENAVSAIKKASDGVPLSELPGRIKRAIVALRQRGLFKGPVDEQTLSVLDEPPTDVSNPASEMNTSAGRVDAATDEDYTGLAGPKESDLTTIDGHPYGTKSGATARANKVGGEVVEVPGGFVVRPKEQDGPDAAGDGGSQPADAGRGAGAERVPDQRPADVLAGPAEPARQSVDVAGADGDGRGGRADALKPGVAPAGDFIPAPNGYKVRITQHSRGSNVLDPTADAGAFIYELRKGDDDHNPLTLVVNKDGKLVAAKTTFGADNASNGTAWVPPNQAAADAVRALLEKRAETPAGSAERKAIDAAIEAAVKPTTQTEAHTTPTEVTPTRRVIGKYGRTPNAATEVDLRPNADGTLTPYEGKYPLVDFESAKPIVMPADVTDAQAVDAIRKAGAITSKDRFYGVKPDAAQQDRPASGPVQPTADSQARADLDAALGDLGNILGARQAETSPPAEGAGASNEGQGQEGRRRETLLNDQAQAQAGATPATPAPRTEARANGKHPATVMGSRLLALVSSRLGGLDPAWLPDFSHRQETKRIGKNGKPIVSWRNPMVTGIGTLFRRGGTQDLQLLAEMLEEAGYLPPGSVEADAKEAGELAKRMVTDALNRVATKTQDQIQAEAEADIEAERNAYYAELDAESAREAEAERQAIIEANSLQGIDRLDDDDIPWDAPIESSPKADADFLGITVEELERERLQGQVQGDAQEQAGDGQGPDANGPEGAQAAAGARGPAPGRGPEDGQEEGLTLAAQTEQDLRAKAEREAAAAAADAKEQKRLADKAKADAQRDEFTLTGSDRPADVAAAAGQRSMFDEPAPTAAPTSPPQAPAPKPAPIQLADAEVFADDFARLEGKTMAQTVTVADTGQTATLKMDAAKAMRAQQARLDALKALRTCLGA